MVSQKVEIKNETGLHARPASEFVKLASDQACDVFVEKDGRQVTAKSILGVLSLAISKGSTVTVSTDGQGEEESLKKIVEFIEGLVD